MALQGPIVVIADHKNAELVGRARRPMGRFRSSRRAGATAPTAIARIEPPPWW